MLHNAVWALRRMLRKLDPTGGSVALVSRTPGYVFQVPEERIDAYAFRAIVAEAKGVREPAAAGEALRRGLRLWRGRVLSDLQDAGLDWPALDGLEQSRLDAWEDYFEAQLSAGRHVEILEELTALVKEEPFRERLRGQLMLGLYRSGRRSEALAAYRDARALLAEELGLDPSDDLRMLEEAILTGDPSLWDEGRPPNARAAALPSPPSRPDVPRAASPRPAWDSRRTSTVLVEIRPAEVLGDAPRLRERELFAALDILRAEIEPFGGVLVGAVGPVLRAAFGARQARDDDAQRAVGAALALRDRFARAGADRTGVDGSGAGVAIAVVTGPALVATDASSSPLAMGVAEDPGAILRPVPEGGVVVCDTTYRACRTQRDFTAAPGGGWAPADAPACRDAGAPLPLVERQQEVALVRQLLETSIRRSQPHLITVLGDAGMGKTRLADEVLAAADEHPRRIRALVSRPSWPGGSAGHCVLADLVKACIGVRDSDPAPVAAGRLDRAVRRVVGDREHAGWVEASLRLLLGLDGATDGQRPPGEVWRAACLLLQAAADTDPLLVVVDDVHPAEEALLDFLCSLTDSPTPRALLVVVTARPELLDRRPGWPAGRRNATTFSLDPLSDAATARLLRSLFARYGRGPFPSPGGSALPFPETLLSHIGGNPFFAEEYVRMLADSDEAGEVKELPLPASVRSAVEARLDCLPEPELGVLMDAAVLGATAWAGAVAALSAMTPQETARHLDRLCLRGHLVRSRRSSVQGESEYAFTHSVVRRIAYERVPPASLVRRHLDAAAWIERLSIEHAGQLAYHYGTAVVLAGETGCLTPALTDRARQVLAQTGARAESLGASGIAARCYRVALDLCPAHDPARPGLLLRCGAALADAEGAGEDLLLEARDALLIGGDPVGAARAEFHLATLADRRVGDPGSRARRARALDLVRDVEGREAAELSSRLAMWLVMDGECAEALEVAESVLSRAAGLQRPAVEADALTARGAARLDLGDLTAVADFERAVRIRAGHRLSTSRALGHLTCALARAGDLTGASAAHAASLRAAEAYGDDLALRMGRGAMVTGQYWAGDWHAALDRTAELLADTASVRLPLRGVWHTVTGRIQWARGDLAAAQRHADLAIAAAGRRQDPQELGPALAFAARIACESNDPARAADLVRELLDLLAGRILLPDVGFDLPLVLSRLGRRESSLDGVPASPWSDAARAFLADEPEAAALVYRRIGSRPDEMQALLVSAHRAAERGDGRGVDRCLAPVEAFAAHTAATAWAAEAERLRGRPRQGV
ncbi:BTAD domain-containing putative transcriptional regulator [Streptomyces sp. NPDC056943]|uniref:BTAD domain-containing putative transcriptional regulator n=1 Tax=Streptomyces sp. NPDC056943 TaxID=3345971 RepID=UPI0036431277